MQAYTPARDQASGQQVTWCGGRNNCFSLFKQVIVADHLKILYFYPRYETLFKQTVSSEDMYLGMSGRDPSSFSCEEMVVRIPHTLNI